MESTRAVPTQTRKMATATAIMISVAINVEPRGTISAKKRLTNGIATPSAPMAAKASTISPRQPTSGRATRARTRIPSTNRTIAFSARNWARSAAFDTSQCMMPGNSHVDSRMDSATAMPPGRANRTTRLRKPGMYRRVFGASARMNAGTPIVNPPM